MTAARYAEILRAEMPGWTVTPHPTERGVLQLVAPDGAEGMVRPSTCAVGTVDAHGIAWWSWGRPEWCGANGARAFAASLREEHPVVAP